jgi:Squalene-hopene cyclase C-terminal domain
VLLASIFDRLHRLLAHPQWGWILLWLGLATLIVTLVVMICTSWGQSHPLRKCAGLSLLAHLLLLGYATTVQIVTGTGNGHHGGGMNLLLVDGGAEGADVGVDDPDAPLTETPWDRPPRGEITAQPADATPQQKAPADAIVDHSLEANSKTATAPTIADSPKPRPPPLLEIAEAKPEAKPAEPPLAEPPQAVAQSPPDAIKPSVPDLPPAPAAMANTNPIEKPSEPLPQTTADVAVPKLPEPPTTDQVGDWMAGPAAGGNLPTRPAPEGPLKDNNASNDMAVAAPKNSASTPSGNRSDLKIVASNGSPAGPNGAEVLGPLVESVAAPITSRGVPQIYADRVASDRVAIARQRGGSPESESAVQAALRWLAINQSDDGRWNADKFGAGHESAVLGQDRQGAGAKADSAVTGLALLAFLGAGNTHLQGDYAKNVQRGLEYLISIQGNDGNLAGKAEMFAYMYSHGMATLAMSEAYAMTGDRRIEPTVQKAIGYTLRAQIRSTGGWRYQAIEKPAERGDTSQLGWQLMSIKSAELAGLEVPGAAGDGAVNFLKSVASGLHGGKASYRPGEAPSRTMTAEALVCRQFLGMARENPASNEAGDYLMSQLPSPDKINLYYWYYGTLGMYQLQGDYWRHWNEAMQTTLVGRQRVDGDDAGSWDPECIWGGYGGRVYSTALSALCLEVYYRYLPIYRVAGRQSQPAGN